MNRTRPTLLTTLILLASGTLSACAQTAETLVAVRSFEFRPTEITVEPGTEVIWRNEDAILHTVTSGRVGEQGVPGVSQDVPPSPDGRFDLELDGRGTMATFTFDEQGSYPYFCAIHSGMSAVIRVG